MASFVRRRLGSRTVAAGYDAFVDLGCAEVENESAVFFDMGVEELEKLFLLEIL